MVKSPLKAPHLLQYSFFALLFVGTASLAFFIFKPFLTILFLSVILAVAFRPFYDMAVRAFGGRRGAAAALTVFVVFALIIAPLSFFVYLLLAEASGLYAHLASNGGAAELVASVNAFGNSLAALIPGGADIDIARYIDVEQYVRGVLEWLVGNVGLLFSSALKTLLSIVLMFMALFHLLVHGESIARTLVLMSPLDNEHDRMILNKASQAINTVVKGRLAMAVIQGMFAGAGFAVFGVPNPVFFGFVTGFSSLVPMVGTALVMVPAVLYLFLMNQFVPAIGLLAWGTIAVGFIDDILGPYLIERGMKIHPFLILISVLGGIRLFGVLGFIAGPVVLAVLFVLVDIYILLTSGAEKAAGAKR